VTHYLALLEPRQILKRPESCTVNMVPQFSYDSRQLIAFSENCGLCYRTRQDIVLYPTLFIYPMTVFFQRVVSFRRTFIKRIQTEKSLLPRLRKTTEFKVILWNCFKGESLRTDA